MSIVLRCLFLATLLVALASVDLNAGCGGCGSSSTISVNSDGTITVSYTISGSGACRCHSKEGECLPGNCISFRPCCCSSGCAKKEQ